MIKNMNELQVTLLAIRRFERDLDHMPIDDLDKSWKTVYTEAIESMIETLQKEVGTYLDGLLDQDN